MALRPMSRLSALWRNRRLVTRLLVLHAVVLSVTMAALILVVGQLASQSLVRQVDRSLVEESAEFGHAAESRPPGQDLRAFTIEYLHRRPLDQGQVIMVGLSGAGVYGSVGSRRLLGAPQVARQLAQPPLRSNITEIAVGATSYRLLAAPIRVSGQSVGVFIVVIDLADIHRQLIQLLLAIAGEAAAALVLAEVGAYLVTRSILGTVGKIREAASRISDQSLGQRLDDPGSADELGRLVRAFNEMLSRLEGTFRAQRRLLSDVSHQLRTPLTVIRGHLEVLKRAGYRDQREVAEAVDLVLDEVEKTAALIERLLLLRRSNEPDFVQRESVELRPLLEDVFLRAQSLGHREWRLSEVPEAVILVDRLKLRSALLSLVENSVKATVPGQSVAIEAKVGDQVALTVTDNGRGIPVEEQARVFHRHHTSGPNSGGSGLGLSIVQAVAEAHGGQVELVSAPGAGCSVSILLPPDCVERPLSEPVRDRS